MCLKRSDLYWNDVSWSFLNSSKIGVIILNISEIFWYILRFTNISVHKNDRDLEGLDVIKFFTYKIIGEEWQLYCL